MKKKIIVICLLMATLVLVFGFSALASSRYVPTYCDQCAAVLSEGGTHMYSYNTTHTVFYDGTFDTCTITHDVSQVQKFCPNGHGVKWTGVWHYLWHSHPYCTDTGYWE